VGNGIMFKMFLDRINKIDRIKKGQANEEENGVPDENLD
jgi:hypothetical protein